MITKHRNRAFIQMGIALVLTVSMVLVFMSLAAKRRQHQDMDSWAALAIVLYLGSYAMWTAASLTLARAKGYPRDFGGALFLGCFILGFCIPIVPVLFPFYILFGLEDRAKRRSH
jgi:hypothetical protein